MSPAVQPPIALGNTDPFFGGGGYLFHCTRYAGTSPTPRVHWRMEWVEMPLMPSHAGRRLRTIDVPDYVLDPSFLKTLTPWLTYADCITEFCGDHRQIPACQCARRMRLAAVSRNVAVRAELTHWIASAFGWPEEATIVSVGAIRLRWAAAASQAKVTYPIQRVDRGP